MKAASVTCVHFSNSFRGSRLFQDNAVLVLSNEIDCWETLLRIMSTTEYPWARVRIFIDEILPLALRHVPIETEVAFKAVLRSCNQLSLVSANNKPAYNKNTFTTSLLNTFLKWTPNLTHLQIDTHLLKHSFSEEIAISDITTSFVENLKSLDILKWNFDSNSFNNNPKYVSIKQPTAPKKNFPEGFKNFQSLLQLLQSAKTLECLRLGNIKATNGVRFYWGYAEAREYILPLLTNNANTLLELTVFDDTLFFLPAFHQLKKLSVGITTDHHQTMLADFMLKHETLEEIELQLGGSMPNRLLARVLGRRSGTIKTFHLKLSFPSNTSGPREFEWNILHSMPRLNDFALSIMNVNDVHSGQKYLESLPKNQLEKLSLEGVGWRIGFWNANNNGGVPFVKQDLLMGFSCLKSLRISNCPDALDDDTLKFILAEFIRLKELEIICCGKISHEGFIERDVHGKVMTFAQKTNSKTNYFFERTILTINHSLANIILCGFSFSELTHLTLKMPWRNNKKNLASVFHAISFPALKYLKFIDSNKKVSGNVKIKLYIIEMPEELLANEWIFCCRYPMNLYLIS